MISNKDHYRTLEVDPTASRADIRAAYRSLAKRFHPDRNPDFPLAEQRFGEVARAYEVLHDPKTRLKYDLLYVPSSVFRGNSSEFRKEAEPDREKAWSDWRERVKEHDLKLQEINSRLRRQESGRSVDREVA